MSFDLREILKSKRALRRELASHPVAEKLRMLVALREAPPPYGKSDDASAVRP